MHREIKQAAVLGAGTMGSRIAGHFANAGIPCLLLDLPGKEGQSRNAPAERALKGLRKSRPPALFTGEALSLIQAGNFEDDLGKLAGVDWVVEAIVENFDIKRSLLDKIDEVRRPGTLISSNTSGLPIGKLAEGYSDDFRAHWMGTHYFNPPRHMRLMELIPTPETDPDVVEFVREFSDKRLGKVVVFANDRPNFIANRIFLFSVMHAVKTMQEQGLSVEEVDALTGPLIGRPRMATFRLADFTGVDVCLYVASNLYDLVPDDERRDVYKAPEFLKKMVEAGLNGDKAGQGYYKKIKSEKGRERLVLDLETLEYRKAKEVAWESVGKASKIADVSERIGYLIGQDDAPGKFLWSTLSELFLYTAARIPEVTEDLVSVDTTMKAGFNWKAGIFEIWNKLGVEATTERMKADGQTLPPLVEKALASPSKSFYADDNGTRTYFELRGEQHKPVPKEEGVLRLAAAKRQTGELKRNDGASLVDLGDGVLCVEFHSKANSLDPDVFAMIREGLDVVAGGYEALVIGNEGENFCVGANLYMILEMSRGSRWDEINESLKQIQQLFGAVRDCPKPVVAAVFAQSLAGGCELALHCDRMQAAAETYMGLVEVGVGLIPAAGGSTEMIRRATAAHSRKDDLIPATRDVFERIGMAKVSNSAAEARQWQYLTASDGISMNRDRLLADAKSAALALAAASYRPAEPSQVLVGGAQTLAAMKLGLYMMREGEYISEYDVHVGKVLAYILAGGNLSEPAHVSREYLLGLEREAFLSLCGEAKTQARIEHLLKTGRPLRN